jgi:triacylglycerol lipase
MSNRTPAAMLALAVAMHAWSQPASAQMPPDIAEKVAALGAVINPPETGKLYAPLQEKEPYQGIKVTRDLRYGPDERNALDLFVPEQAAGGPRAVLMFVHGGGFTAGSKRAPGSPFYDNIVLFAARNGLVGVNVTYRLAPQHKWPAGAQDVGAAVAWVGANIAGHGGDPARVFLMGHSAGAVHVASYVAHAQFHGTKGSGLAGAILVSGLYDFAKYPTSAPEKSYFGDDAAVRLAAASAAGLAKGATPLLVVHGEVDPPLFVAQAKGLNEALCKAGRCPRFVALPKHSHMSEVYAINTRDTELSGQVLAFVKGGK